MSYTNTKAQTGLGTVVAVGATPTTINEVFDVKFSGQKWGTEDATNLSSSAAETIVTIPDWGEMQLDCNRVSSDAGQTILDAVFTSTTQAANTFTVTFPKLAGQSTNGDKIVFLGLITQREWGISPTKKTTVTYHVKITGMPTFTEGT